MKLFGNKKSGKDAASAADVNISEDVLENVELNRQEIDEDIVSDVVIPEITVVEDIVLPDEAEEEADIEMPVMEQDAPLTGEEGYVNSIAETFGIPADQLVNESAAEPVPVEEPAGGKKKLTRAEKKEAKKAAKIAKKEEKKAAKQARREARKWSLGKKILVTLMLIFAVAITGFAGYFVREMWVTQEQLDVYDADFSGEIQRHDEVIVPNTDPSQDGQDVTEEIDSTRKKGCYTFLVAARDVASGCTDVIIVGMFDTVNGKINMVSIPRDTLINKGLLKVNTAYQGNLASGGNGIDGLLKEMKKILGFEIDSWAVVDVEAMEKLIDAIGGVYFDVPMEMLYVDDKQGLQIYIKEGYQKLSGSDAVKVLRFRKGYANGDLGRINVQHDFIKALAEQILDVGNIPNLGAAIDIYQEHVQSNLTAGNILFYAKHFLEMDPDNIQFVDMPQMMGGLVNGQSYIFINPTKWIKVINEYLNPYKDDITSRNLSIKTSADQGASFYYTGG
ncbi:MAG: LCP family protein [Oscillospiraceae bacterium]|nr:LCP family protein [Oscillospiraceae bacterium]